MLKKSLVNRLCPADATYSVLNSTAEPPIRNSPHVQLPNTLTYMFANCDIVSLPEGCRSSRCRTVAPRE